MMGSRGLAFRREEQTLSPSVPGIMMSSTTRSGRASPQAASRKSPLEKVRT